VFDGGIHHVGMTVSDLDAALAFWEAFLGVEARVRATLERPYVGATVGHPGTRIGAAFVDLPGGNLLELLDYREVEARTGLPQDSANPGHVHLCLRVADIDAVYERALAAGARPVRPGGPIESDGGPNRGARIVYLRIPPDGATVELFQPPPG
jgi:catechol 2,3-dioxygenase-like lactoylglutathione lyase family enzyme